MMAALIGVSFGGDMCAVKLGREVHIQILVMRVNVMYNKHIYINISTNILISRWMYAYMHTHTQRKTHTDTHTYTHTHTHTQTHIIPVAIRA